MKKIRVALILAVWVMLGSLKTQADADCQIVVASDPHYIASSLTDGGPY